MTWPLTQAVLQDSRVDIVSQGPAGCNAPFMMSGLVENQRSLTQTFGDPVPADARISSTGCFESGRVGLRLQANVQRIDGDTRATLDQSWLGIEWGGALWSVGAVDRFWGPGWSGSLILGNNSRPIPALSIRRADPAPFETKWLSWIGPWDGEIFFGELQGHTEPRRPRFVGIRLTASPLSWLDLGLARALQWGGEGRSNSLSTLWKGLSGKDNVGDPGIPSPQEDPGNQLIAADARVSLARVGAPIAVYGQIAGEDQAGYTPSRRFYLAGAEAWWSTGQVRWRIVGEYVNTTVRHQDQPEYGTAYRHYIYQQGYTQHGRVLGWGLGGDVRTSIAQLHAFFSQGGYASLRLLTGKANEGSLAVRPFPPSSSLDAAELRVRVLWRDRWWLEGWAGLNRVKPLGGQREQDGIVGASILFGS